MTTNETKKLNGVPRHAGPTREVPLVGYQPRHEPKHLNARVDGATAQPWPLVDPQPTKALRRPTPKPSKVEVEPARRSWLPKATMTAEDAQAMQKACLWAALLVAVFGVLAFVAVNVAGMS